MAIIEVTHAGGDQFVASARGHQVTVDQPFDDGGADTGPTPTEFFVIGLASCVAHYARRFLARHQLDPSGLAVTAEFTMATDRPARVASVTITIRPPVSLPDDRRAAFLAVASHCTVHNSLTDPPGVTIGLGDGSADAAA